ncbi:glycoside hydrolase family 3 C-terminal domain-containing protein [Kribbella sp. NBC_01245]|uniref:beta-glucosidase family protein n=1 Tax=Kribbella sp. NBC_01245 TaxID=2903578 RepID=UPI002E2D8E4E|nr:glycoside hydrolase family 3 C-terminal domain-containing protein [Kribbella sp. NBC_01245]
MANPGAAGDERLGSAPAVEACRDLAASLDLRTKVRLLTGSGYFTVAAEESIGLRELRMSDGPSGVRGTDAPQAAALLPNATLVAASWSEQTASVVGEILAEEAAAQNVHLLLGPTINLHRSVLGGRLFEAFSEDPLLTGRLAAAYVSALQRRGIGACPKHFVANESETERTTVSVEMDEATLREVYLLPFEIVVQDADPWSIMAAYNRVSGVPATENRRLLTGVLRDEWGWNGLVVSDWGATTSDVASATAGLDLVMPGPEGPWGAALVNAVETGMLAESVIDEHVVRLLILAMRTGVLDGSGPPLRSTQDPESRRAQLTTLAAAGCTVLTNHGATLPLDRDSRVALIGRHAIETVCLGGGSAEVMPPYTVSIAEGLSELLGDRLIVAGGVEVRDRPPAAQPEVVTDPVTGRPGVRCVVLSEDGCVLVDGHRPAAKDLISDPPGGRVDTILLRALVPLGGYLEVGGIGVGDWEILAGDERITFSLRVSGRCFGEEALAPPVSTARVVMSPGTLVEARVAVGPAFQAHRPVYGNWGLVARSVPPDDADSIARAASAAAAADVAVVVVGTTQEQETESIDKSTIRLPGAQDAMVSAVAARARRTVVVVNAATPVLMPWLDEVDAIVWCGLPGQEGGRGVAAALLGDIEPAGRLVTTFPAEDGAAPAWAVTPSEGRLTYREGRFIGYRGHWAGLAPEPAFWFGHGLGYGAWEYGSPTAAREGDDVVVTVEVTNAGIRESREVVQVYVEPAGTEEPIRLAGWTSVTVAPGATVTARVVIDSRICRRWDQARGGWVAVADGNGLVVARGLGDIRGRVRAPRSS